MSAERDLLPVSVSIHAPAGGATKLPGDPRWLCKVSIHAPAGGATAVRCLVPLLWAGFDPRARRGRDTVDRFLGYSDTRFDPRARRGRDLLVSHWKTPSVSIHAPAGGATVSKRSTPQWLTVSIHAPAAGATSAMMRHMTSWWVSIHAPAGGATRRVAAGQGVACGFDPRARRGRDRIASLKCRCHSRFRSTRPQGARRTT